MKIGGGINQCFWPHWIPDQPYLRCPRAEVGPFQNPSLAPSMRSPLRWWPGSCWSRSGARSAWWWRFSRLPGLRSPAPCTGAPSGGPACRWGTTCGWSCSLWDPQPAARSGSGSLLEENLCLSPPARRVSLLSWKRPPFMEVCDAFKGWMWTCTSHAAFRLSQVRCTCRDGSQAPKADLVNCFCFFLIWKTVNRKKRQEDRKKNPNVLNE